MTPTVNKAKKKNSYTTYACYLFLLALLALSSILLYPAYKEYKERSRELEKLQNELTELKKQRDLKAKLYNSLGTSPAAVEKVAREKYRMVKEGETVLLFAKDNAEEKKAKKSEL